MNIPTPTSNGQEVSCQQVLLHTLSAWFLVVYVFTRNFLRRRLTMSSHVPTSASPLETQRMESCFNTSTSPGPASGSGRNDSLSYDLPNSPRTHATFLEAALGYSDIMLKAFMPSTRHPIPQEYGDEYEEVRVHCHWSSMLLSQPKSVWMHFALPGCLTGAINELSLFLGFYLFILWLSQWNLKRYCNLGNVWIKVWARCYVSVAVSWRLTKLRLNPRGHGYLFRHSVQLAYVTQGKIALTKCMFRPNVCLLSRDTTHSRIHRGFRSKLKKIVPTTDSFRCTEM